MTSDLALLIVFLTSLSACYGQCDFDSRWRAGRWVLHNQFPINNTRLLLTYKDDYGYESYSNVPDTVITEFSCDEFDKSGDHSYYVKSESSHPDKKICVDDIQTANVILHREVEHDASSGSATTIKCKTQLSKINLFDVLLPVATPTPDPNFFPQSIPYPFDNMAYRVWFTLPNGTKECSTSINSVLVASPEIISILACKYDQYTNFPLTGLIEPVSVIDPQALGEEDDRNGKILIMKWSSRSIPFNRTYCVRYMTVEDRDILLSFDLTSAEPGNKLQCRKGHHYNDSGIIEGREYFTMRLHFDQLLISRPPSEITPTSRPNPESSSLSTTLLSTSPPTGTRRVTMILVVPYSDIKDKNQFQSDVTTVLFLLLGVSKNDITNVRVSMVPGDDRYTMMSFDLHDDSSAVISSLRKMVNEDGLAITVNGFDKIGVKNNSVYYLKDGNCPTAPCPDGKMCLSEGDSWSCACITDVCADAAASSGENTNYVIIGVVVGVLLVVVIVVVIVVVVVRKRRNKMPDSDDSEMTFTNSNSNSKSLEALDRELYSTINKKPKAYHEKSFSSLDKDEDYGEKTGIHL